MKIEVLSSGSQAGNCIYVSDGAYPLLLECGIPWPKIQRAIDTSKLAGCLVTHEHLDHAKSLKAVCKAGIDCYAPASTFKALGVAGHRAHPLQEGMFSIESWNIVAFKVEHDAAETFGFVAASAASGEKLLYLTDTSYVRYKFPGLTHVIVEANYAEDLLQESVRLSIVNPTVMQRVRKYHFGLHNVKEMLKANDLSKVQAIHLVHLSENNADPARFKREIQELTGKPVYVIPLQ